MLIYWYTSNQGNVTVDIMVASTPTIDFNSWLLQENSLNWSQIASTHRKTQDIKNSYRKSLSDNF